MTIFKRDEQQAMTRSGSAGFAIVKHDLDEHTSVIAIEGELDISTAPRLKAALLDTLESGREQIVVDLSLVRFIDSTALAVLVGVNRRLEPGARLAIVWDKDVVLQIFEFSGTDGLFAIFHSLDEALTHVQGHTAASG